MLSWRILSLKYAVSRKLLARLQVEFSPILQHYLTGRRTGSEHLRLELYTRDGRKCSAARCSPCPCCRSSDARLARRSRARNGAGGFI